MSEQPGPVVFDRAADFYDRTRALTPEAMAAVIDLLTAELRGRGSCLEVGVGTGRMALPLHARGVRMIGMDLSRPMLDRLVANAGGRAPFPLALADATRLPAGDGSVAAGLLCHVLHLIPGWRQVVAELVRVVSGGGVVLVDPGSVGWEPDELEQVFRRAAGITVRDVGLGSVAELDEAFAGHGATVRPLPGVEERRVRSVRERLRAWEQNLYSFTWPLSEDDRLRAVEEAAAWARSNVADLDAPVERTVEIGWRAYDIP